MAAAKYKSTMIPGMIKKGDKEFTGTGTPVTKKLADGRIVIVGEIPNKKKGGKRVPVGQRNNSFIPEQTTEVINAVEESFIKVERGAKGADLAESIITMLTYLSLPERNEVIELVLRQLVVSALNETDDKRTAYHQADKATEHLHMIISGGIVNGNAGKANDSLSLHR